MSVFHHWPMPRLQFGMGRPSKVSKAASRCSRSQAGSSRRADSASTAAREIPASGPWPLPGAVAGAPAGTVSLRPLMRNLALAGQDGLRQTQLLAQPFVALLLQLQGQLPAARLHDAPADHDMHVVGLNVIQDALVVGD